MVEERNHTTIIKEGGSGASGWVIALVLLVALVVGDVRFTQLGGSEISKNNAIEKAAGQVGNAANKVGDVAEDSADTVTK